MSKISRSARWQLIDRALEEPVGRSGSEIRVKCPFCVENTGKEDVKGALSVNTASGYWYCYKCSEKGKLYGDQYTDLEVPRSKITKISKPEGFHELADDTSLVFTEAREYLARRLPRNRWAITGVGACCKGAMAGRIIIPILSAAKTWIGYVGRSWYSKHPLPYRYPFGWDRKPVLYNEVALDGPTDRPLFVVEGVFDALHFWDDDQRYPDAVAVLGKPTDEQVTRIAACQRPVVIVLDPDAEGTAKAMRDILLYERGWRGRPTPNRGAMVTMLDLPSGLDPDQIKLSDLRIEAAHKLNADRIEIEDWI